MKGKQFQKNKEPRQVLLYRNVFYSRVSATVVLLLLASFVLQPFERSFASALVSENSSTPETIVNLAVDTQLSNGNSDDALSEATLDEAPALISDSETPVGINGSPPEAMESINTDQNIQARDLMSVSSTSSEIESESHGSGNTDTESDSDSSGTTTDFTDEEIQDLITPADEIPKTVIEEALANATSTAVAVSNVYSDATMQFNKSDCVTVEDGSFYCQVKKDDTETETDGLFAMQDIDGDLEIFVRKEGELTQITFNTIDDAAPFFDSSSNSIVWHRLIDDRYQIISYLINTKEEIQLTAEAVNNMEPSRSGPNTVWQRWNSDNWDIVLYNGTETIFITDSGMHDIAPKIKGDLVMWNRLHPDTTQTIELYDIATKEFTTISDTEGGALSNPRMVLVYETEFENGDIITKGYDIETGEITPITTKAADIPDELPEPDATGETRALLPVKNPTEEEGELNNDLVPGITPHDSVDTPVTINPGDLVIASTTVPVVTVQQPATTTLSNLDLTLDLTPIISAEEVAMTLAIPAYTAPISTANVPVEDNKY